jgi:hypothetical protein
MAIRFAAARTLPCAIVARVLSVRRLPRPANDTDQPLGREGLLRKALWHFSNHGLAAATLARENAVRALRRGDRVEFHNWLAICRLLDRRMGDAARKKAPAKQIGHPRPAQQHPARPSDAPPPAAAAASPPRAPIAAKPTLTLVHTTRP